MDNDGENSFINKYLSIFYIPGTMKVGKQHVKSIELLRANYGFPKPFSQAFFALLTLPIPISPNKSRLHLNIQNEMETL